MSKKKIFLYAYDKVNLGDDLFIRTIVNRYPQVQFYLWSEKSNEKVFADCHNLKIVDKDSKSIQMLKKIRPSLAARYQEDLKKKCDAVVYIGGSIFMEYPTWKNIVEWWKYQAEHYKFYVLGANFGPYKTEEYKVAMGQVFEQLEDVCFRDKFSYELFEDNKKVRYAPDIIFSYSMPEVTEPKKQVFISVIDCNQKENGKFKQYTESYEKKIVQLAENYLNKGYQIKLVSFCEAEGDEAAVNRIFEKMTCESNYESIVPLYYKGDNYKDILNELALSEIVVATRFHAIVLGLVSGKNVLPILYSDKSKYLLKDIGYLDKYADLREVRDSASKASYINKSVENLTFVKQMGELHFKKLDKVLTQINKFS